MPTAPGFWRRRWSPTAQVLRPVAVLYGRTAARRMAEPGVRAPLPVLCIGNYVAGGAGKTPTAIAIAGIAEAMGLRPAILTRGYGGRMRGPVLVDLSHHRAGDVGDEALLLARAAPTVVGRDRLAAARLAADAGCDLLLMDDGFQSPSIVKDFNLVVVDAGFGIGNGYAMPAGPLRAPFAVQLAATDAVLMVGEGAAGIAVIRGAARAGKPVLHARLASRETAALAGKPLLAFSGIGRPQKFFDSLATAGLDVSLAQGFPDHYVYREDDARRLLILADERGLTPVTTEKDAVRLAGAQRGAVAELAARSAVFGVDMVFDDPALIRTAIEEARRRFVRAGR
jgi:tetraacyldisaccharide 4'-kinase